MAAVRIVALSLALLLAACSQPLPAAKASYAGDWRAQNVQLVITADGYVQYQRKSGHANTSINAPIQGFEGDNFVVGVGFFRTTFVVSRPPHREGNTWKMTVDGVELKRNGVGPADDYV
jgi:hypothetical protein